MAEFTTQEAAAIAARIGIDFGHEAFDLDEFSRGINVELEHGSRDPRTNVTNDDPEATAKIAWAHLIAIPDYYTRLSAMSAEPSTGATATPPAPRANRSEVSFDSAGVRCAADLYRPLNATGRVPCVVMGHGFSGTRDLGLATYAEHFAAAGVAALVFDYRHFGASGGTPRQLIDIQGQQDDYRAAIRYARSLPDIDAARIALWGTSLSGGHVVAVAVEDPGIVAVVSQVPWMGIEFTRTGSRSLRTTLGAFVAAIMDWAGARLGLAPYFLPVVGGPGEPAAFSDPETRKAVERLSASAPSWENRFAARALFGLLRYRPGTLAKRLAMPLLVCVADRDVETSVPLAIRAANEAPRGELRRYPVGHFDAYLDAADQIATDEAEFLQRYLRTGG